MKTIVTYILLVLIFYSIGCIENIPVSKTPLLQKDTTKKLEKLNTLFAFVGEKVSIQEDTTVKNVFDNVYVAKYKIIQRVYGAYQFDTIAFKIFDHYGLPDFVHLKNVLLYVSKGESYYYLEKYQYNEVYRTKDGRWAGYSYDYLNQIDQTRKIIPQKIPFTNDAPKDSGNYVEDLFLLKKNSVLAYRGLFGDTIPSIEPLEIEMLTLDSTELKRQPK